MNVCDQSKCNKCDLGYILSNYITPLMQCLTNDIKEFNMQLLTTKCLNTAVMLMFFLLGKGGIKRALSCDATALVERAQQKPINNMSIMKSITNNVLSKKTKHRYLFYILVNDATLKFINSDETIYFPGHVFVLEKYNTDDGYAFHLYQSYINEYDLKGYNNMNNGTFDFSFEDMKILLSKITYILTNNIWDEKCIQYWKDFTKVDTSMFHNSIQKDKLFVCYTHDKITSCLRNIEDYTKSKLNILSQTPQRETVFGNQMLYNNNNVQPLTSQEMHNNLINIIHDINIHKKQNNI